MTQWEITTPWRQGHLLTDEALRAVFSDVADHDAIGVVVSHSCDLARSPEKEPVVEVIVGKRTPTVDGNYSYAKNARTLHLTAGTSQGPVHFELSACDKRQVGKHQLAQWPPDGQRTIAPREVDVLQHWLAARYRRAAFPGAFNDRLAEAGIHKKLSKLLEPLGADIVCLFFDVDDGRDEEKQAEMDTYLLRIAVVYTIAKNANAEESATALASEINDLFEKRFLDPKSGSWESVELAECYAVSADVLSYQQSRSFKKWDGDHISLRSKEEQPILE